MHDINIENHYHINNLQNKLKSTAKEDCFSEHFTGHSEHMLNTEVMASNTFCFHQKTGDNSSELSNSKQRVRRQRRPRRRRKGKIHRAGAADFNGNNWRYNIGAPRNDNEFLLNQSTSTPGDHIRESDSETPFPYATSDDEIDTCPICHGMEMKNDSGIDSESSDYASSPNQRHVCLPNQMSSLNICSDHQDQDRNIENQIQNVTGPDLSFLERNFEAEYEDNLMTVLNDCSKDDLVTRCRELMNRVKELENSRGTSSPSKN